MKQQTIVVAGLIALAGLTGLAGMVCATELREKRALDKPQVATPGASTNSLLSHGGREAIIKAALTAVHKSVQVDVRERDEDKTPLRFWGEAIQKLRPLRVVNDRMNVMIVLTDDSHNEKGLYVGNPISSYGVPNFRFAAFELLSKPEDKSFGWLSRYDTRKKQRTANIRQGDGRVTKYR